MTTIEVLSPEGARSRADVAPAPRLPGLSGARVGLHDNRKPGGLRLLESVGEGLGACGAELRRWSKSHAARPSPNIGEMAGNVDAAVFALGD